MPIPLRCRLGWHSWGKWTAPEGEIWSKVLPNNGGTFDFKKYVQIRVCAGCCISERRILNEGTAQ